VLGADWWEGGEGERGDRRERDGGREEERGEEVPLGGLRAVAAVGADVRVVWAVAVAAHGIAACVVGVALVHASLVDVVIVAARLDVCDLVMGIVVHCLGLVSRVIAASVAIRHVVVHVDDDEMLVDKETMKRSQARLWCLSW
jgi:hypothetical protein